MLPSVDVTVLLLESQWPEYSTKHPCWDCNPYCKVLAGFHAREVSASTKDCKARDNIHNTKHEAEDVGRKKDPTTIRLRVLYFFRVSLIFGVITLHHPSSKSHPQDFTQTPMINPWTSTKTGHYYAAISTSVARRD